MFNYTISPPLTRLHAAHAVARGDTNSTTLSQSLSSDRRGGSLLSRPRPPSLHDRLHSSMNSLRNTSTAAKLAIFFGILFVFTYIRNQIVYPSVQSGKWNIRPAQIYEGDSTKAGCVSVSRTGDLIIDSRGTLCFVGENLFLQAVCVPIKKWTIKAVVQRRSWAEYG